MDQDVTTFEAEFIEGVLYKYDGPLTTGQRRVAHEIIKDYLGESPK
jgi:hypothetical protein